MRVRVCACVPVRACVVGRRVGREVEKKGHEAVGRPRGRRQSLTPRALPLALLEGGGANTRLAAVTGD